MLQAGTALPSPLYVSAVGTGVLCGELVSLAPAGEAACHRREGAHGGARVSAGFLLVSAFRTRTARGVLAPAESLGRALCVLQSCLLVVYRDSGWLSRSPYVSVLGWNCT